jgi:hypothetical protein
MIWILFWSFNEILVIMSLLILIEWMLFDFYFGRRWWEWSTNFYYWSAVHFGCLGFWDADFWVVGLWESFSEVF